MKTLSELIPDLIVSDGSGGIALKVIPTFENTAPTNILLSNLEVTSGDILDTRVGLLSVIDENNSGFHTLEIVGDKDSKFGIENKTTSDDQGSYLVLKDSVDFKVKEHHDVIIKATDESGLFVVIKFTITVLSSFFNKTSVEFDGLSEYITGGDVHSYDINEAFSICLWVKPSNLAGAMILFSKASASVKGYMLRSNATTGQLFLQLRSDILTSHTFDTVITANEWQFVCLTYSGSSNISGASVYRNGVKNASSPVGGLAGSYMTGQPFILGQRNNSFGFYNGLMDEISVWDKELSQAEISELYALGVPDDIKQHSASANNTSWYRFDDDIIPAIKDHTGGNNLTTVDMTINNLTSDVPA